MSGQYPSVLKKYARFFISLVISCGITGLLLLTGIIAFWDTALYDSCVNFRVLHGQETQNPTIFYVDLDDISEELLGSRIDTRQAFADAMVVLGKINASVVIDFTFRYEKDKDNDAVFVDALKGAVDPVLAVVAVDKEIIGLPFRDLEDPEKQMLRDYIWHIDVKNSGAIPEARTFSLPFGTLGAAASYLGHVNIEPDSDGKYRRVPLLYKWEDGYIPSLPLAAAFLREGFPIESIELDAGHYLTLSYSENDKIRIPIDKKGNMLIPYTQKYAGSNHKSLNAAVEAKEDQAVYQSEFGGLRNLIALVTDTSSAGKDFGPTSFESLFPLSRIHASVLGSILDGQNKRAFISMPSVFFKILAILLLLIAAFFCIKAPRDIQFHLGFILTLLLFTGITMYRWIDAAIAPWYAVPAILFFFLWLSAYLFRLLARYHEQELLKNALSRYFPRALAERLMREKRTDLKPAHKELTVLFSDISGFTKWSSDKNPEQVHLFLSDYLESMAEILFSHGGNVDKFMGDGILAFFGDPFEMPDHCVRCVRAAIAMREKIIELAEKWRHVVDIDLRVRIGINIGNVIVGNLGTKTRIEYTVIGAAVNLAQRMESNAPVGGILVTAAVWEKVKDLFTFSEKRQVVVKGYGDPIEAYEVNGG